MRKPLERDRNGPQVHCILGEEKKKRPVLPGSESFVKPRNGCVWALFWFGLVWFFGSDTATTPEAMRISYENSSSG